MCSLGQVKDKSGTAALIGCLSTCFPEIPPVSFPGNFLDAMLLKTLTNKLQSSRYATSLRELRRDIVFSPSVARDIRENEKMRLLYAWILQKDSNCIDIGAHTGTYLGLFNRLAPKGNHIAFEPIPALASYLQDHFPSNKIYNMALGNSCGKVEFYVVGGLESWSGLEKSAYPGKYVATPIMVEINKLDSILPPPYKPDLIKVDVEGAELNVFLGSLSLLHECKPFLVFENSPNQYSAHGVKPFDLFELLVKELEYQIFSIDGAGPLSFQHFSELSEAGRCINFVAHQ